MIADGKVFQKTDSTPQASINEDMFLQNQVLVRHLIRNPAMMTMQEVEGKCLRCPALVVIRRHQLLIWTK
jgi:hypothetical protein